MYVSPVKSKPRPSNTKPLRAILIVYLVQGIILSSTYTSILANVAARGGAREPQGDWTPCRCTAAAYLVPLLRPRTTPE